jgi:hypothetical protein
MANARRFWVAAGLVYALRTWFGSRKERKLIDKGTGREVALSSESALFFISVRFWPAILLGLGVAFFFVRE